ncbi:aspartate/glutamate racemase family protein [Oceanimonas baumannii]|uniref:Aspartate racemase n=1 Tax=Oceanimonas baumannii TaxID=129578 RepID=A0A235CLW8_9GAMM|nr:amino acid racemase [Oceanimonas baumannii]MCC4265179.1 amino acid racemase [Oceanimonas baumannii]OYD25017.1 aspartate racemase [Oceanimonas baumannii]TDW59792.1 aspartate racemase [Oceanimonas baumannii]
MSSLIGILGGMGPLATVDFVTKIINQTPATQDQDHLPLLVHSVPQIPDRTACLLEDKESPLEALLQGLNTLINGGAGCIAIPCNTAHYWYEPLARESSVPILHIARVCADMLAREQVRSVGLLATDGTLKAGFYGRELAEYGIELTTPPADLQRRVMEGIYLVKSGAVEQGARMLDDCMAAMLQLGVERVILGCTEIPFALDTLGSAHAHLGVDATKALAAACVQWHQQQKLAVAA